MYTEEYERRGFPIRSILLTILLIGVFVVLWVWAVPKLSSIKNVVKKPSQE